jgi:two-component system, sensor histidine kinase and response regulator
VTKILVIEDEAILRGEVVEWLQLEGYEALSAADGMAGLDAAFANLPDLIVCDITMPLLDGYGVLLEMRSNPKTAATPFIFVTARAAHEDIRRGMILGADDYITKPFTRLELLQAIQSRLDKKAAQEQQRQREIEDLQKALMQEYEQRMLNTKLVAMFSHDFRNPLAGILSSNSLLRDYADRMDEQRRLAHLNRIEASVRQLMQMLDDMLVVAQMETGHFDFRPEPLYVDVFFQQVVEEFQMMHSGTHQIVFENHFPRTLMADPRLLRQIASNLISNAIKYSHPGSGVYILVEENDGSCLLMFQDQGIGIPESDQTRLFGAFQRGSNVGPVRGTGLGLAIVKQSVELHKGSVHLESKEGKGTTVRVMIPTQSR